MTSEYVFPRSLKCRYSPICIVGRGGMGIVVQAQDLKLKRRVAIKLLAPDLGPGAAEYERFTKREMSALAKLSHSNVVRLFDAGVSEECPYIVMEFLSGCTLAERLSASRLSVDEVRNLLTQALAGLEELHLAGLIHRDIKPSNIFLHEDGRIILIDLGLVRHLSIVEELTKTGSILGTPRYLTPESVRGHELTIQTDLFCLAHAAFEALEQENIHGDAIGATGSTILMSTLSSLGSGLYFHKVCQTLKNRGRVGIALTCALSPEPERRPSSAAAMLAMLDEAQAPQHPNATSELRLDDGRLPVRPVRGGSLRPLDPDKSADASLQTRRLQRCAAVLCAMVVVSTGALCNRSQRRDSSSLLASPVSTPSATQVSASDLFERVAVLVAEVDGLWTSVGGRQEQRPGTLDSQYASHAAKLDQTRLESIPACRLLVRQCTALIQDGAQRSPSNESLWLELAILVEEALELVAVVSKDRPGTLSGEVIVLTRALQLVNGSVLVNSIREALVQEAGLRSHDDSAARILAASRLEDAAALLSSRSDPLGLSARVRFLARAAHHRYRGLKHTVQGTAPDGQRRSYVRVQQQVVDAGEGIAGQISGWKDRRMTHSTARYLIYAAASVAEEEGVDANSRRRAIEVACRLCAALGPVLTKDARGALPAKLRQLTDASSRLQIACDCGDQPSPNAFSPRTH